MRERVQENVRHNGADMTMFVREKNRHGTVVQSWWPKSNLNCGTIERLLIRDDTFIVTDK